MQTKACVEADPEYIRIDDVTKRFSWSRAFTYDLLAKGLIRAKHIRRPGYVRGFKLINVESVRKFIESQPES